MPDIYETTLCASHHLDMKLSDNLISRGYVSQNTAVCVSYLLGRRHVSAIVGHPQVTKIYNEEKI